MKHRHVGGKHEGRVMITGLDGVDGSDYGLTAELTYNCFCNGENNASSLVRNGACVSDFVVLVLI